MFTTRRGFLEVLGLATGGLLLRNTPLGTAYAAGTDPKFLLLVYFEGGWDQLLSLDPRNATLAQYQRQSGRAPTSGIEPAYAETAAATPFVTFRSCFAPANRAPSRRMPSVYVGKGMPSSTLKRSSISRGLSSRVMTWVASSATR